MALGPVWTNQFLCPVGPWPSPQGRMQGSWQRDPGENLILKSSGKGLLWALGTGGWQILDLGGVEASWESVRSPKGEE